MAHTTYETPDLAHRIAALDAPSNLGLRPPAEGVAPGVYKLAGALRDTGLLRRVDAVDAGVVTPPRYLPAPLPGEAVRNEAAQARYALRLADRVGALLDAGAFPLVLGGDCSILLGPALALARRGRYGLLYVDGHDDFTHPGNADSDALSTAGADVALVDRARRGAGRPRGPPPAPGRPGRRAHRRPRGVPRDPGAAARSSPSTPAATSSSAARAAVAADAVATLAGARSRGRVAARRRGRDRLRARCRPSTRRRPTASASRTSRRCSAGLLALGPRRRALQVTILDPDLDEDGTLVARFADILAAGLAARVPVAASAGRQPHREPQRPQLGRAQRAPRAGLELAEVEARHPGAPARGGPRPPAGGSAGRRAARRAGGRPAAARRRPRSARQGQRRHQARRVREVDGSPGGLVQQHPGGRPARTAPRRRASPTRPAPRGTPGRRRARRRRPRGRGGPGPRRSAACRARRRPGSG